MSRETLKTIAVQDAKELFTTLDVLLEAITRVESAGETGAIEDLYAAMDQAEVVLQSMDGDYGS